MSESAKTVREEESMSDPNAQPPGPDPALQRLDRFVGTWEMKGRTLDSDVDNGEGREGPGNVPYDISGRRAS
jgi:hypothetical protein